MHCQITDFGLAKLQATSIQDKNDRSGSFYPAMGTAAYIGPEHYNAQKLDISSLIKSDVYR